MKKNTVGPFEIFTDFPEVWGPLYGGCILIGAGCLLFGGKLLGVLFIGGAIGSALLISLLSILMWIMDATAERGKK